MTSLPTSTVILAHFANAKLSGDRAVQTALTSLTETTRTTTTGHARNQHGTHATTPRTTTRNGAWSHMGQASGWGRRRRRPRLGVNGNARVNTMSDADLQAELSARRAARAREREHYAKMLRSEKLVALETELMRLRAEMARVDVSGAVGAGTPPSSKWEALPGARRGESVVTPTAPTAPPAAPPLPPRQQEDDGGTEIVKGIDAEAIKRRKEEKEERMRRRDAKRKEREAKKKRLTLAEIIKGVGPDPTKILKPRGSIPVGDMMDSDGEKDVDEKKGEEKSDNEDIKKAAVDTKKSDAANEEEEKCGDGHVKKDEWDTKKEATTNEGEETNGNEDIKMDAVKTKIKTGMQEEAENDVGQQGGEEAGGKPDMQQVSERAGEQAIEQANGSTDVAKKDRKQGKENSVTDKREATQAVSSTDGSVRNDANVADKAERISRRRAALEEKRKRRRDAAKGSGSCDGSAAKPREEGSVGEGNKGQDGEDEKEKMPKINLADVLKSTNALKFD